MKYKSLLLLGLIVVFSSFKLIRHRQEHKTIWMIGDSTMSVKERESYPETGWGMPFADFFEQDVKIENRAKNGRSTKTFISEGLWAPVLEHLQQGDYVLIQFGHNDEAKTKSRYTPENEFELNLKRFVTETKSKGAVPVLLTPVTRRKFDQEGKIAETHPGYSELVRKVAMAQGVTLIDLDESSRALLQGMGEEGSKLLFNQLAPGEHPNYPEGKEDNTHFNELGARKVAELVLQEMRTKNVGLTAWVTKGKKTK